MKSAQLRTSQVNEHLKSLYALSLFAVILTVLIWIRLVRSGASFQNDSLVRIMDAVAYILLICGLALAIGLVIAIPIIRSRMPTDPVYAVSVRYRFRTRIAAVSIDQAYIEQIREAVTYALARRDNMAGAIAPQETWNHPAQPPMPLIWNNSVYVGQIEYNLTEVRSTRLWAIQHYRWLSMLPIGMITLQQLTMFASDYFAGSSLAILIGLFIIVIPVFLLVAIFSIASLTSVTYVVQLTSRMGARTIVYATLSRDEAKQVEQGIKYAMQATQAVGQT